MQAAWTLDVELGGQSSGFSPYSRAGAALRSAPRRLNNDLFPRRGPVQHARNVKPRVSVARVLRVFC